MLTAEEIRQRKEERKSKGKKYFTTDEVFDKWILENAIDYDRRKNNGSW